MSRSPSARRRAEEFPGAPPENLVAGSVVFSPPDHAVPLDDHFQWWAYVDGANWRHPTGPDSDLKGRERFPGRARRLRRCRGVREVGRQAPADRGRMGVCRARRPVRASLSLGRRVPARRQVHGEHVPGAFPERRHGGGRLRRHRAGRAVTRRTATACTTWPATSGNGQRLVSARLLRANSPKRGRCRATRRARRRRSIRASRA